MNLFRPLIREDMWPKYPRLLAMFHIELDQAKIIFDKQMEFGKEHDGKMKNKNSLVEKDSVNHFC